MNDLCFYDPSTITSSPHNEILPPSFSLPPNLRFYDPESSSTEEKKTLSKNTPIFPPLQLYDPNDTGEDNYEHIILDNDHWSQCIKNASKGNPNCWVAAQKKGTWGKGKGTIVLENGSKLDVAIYMGSKGEHALAQYCMKTYNILLSTSDQKTNTPNTCYDFPDFPTAGKTTEVKTSNPRVRNALIKVQELNHVTGTYYWLHQNNPRSVQGLSADYYIFCKSEEDPYDAKVSIAGWISREEILEHYSTPTLPVKRTNDWKNFCIPWHKLKPIASLFVP